MPIAFDAVNAAAGESFAVSASPVITRPGAAAAGKVYVAVTATDTGHVSTAPAGANPTWTKVAQIDVGTICSVTVLVGVTSGSEGATITLTSLFNATESGKIGVASYTGVDTTTPQDVAATTVNEGSGTTSPHDGAAITPITAGAWIVYAGGEDPGTSTTRTATPDASPAATERLDGTGDANGWVYIQDFAWVSGATQLGCTTDAAARMGIVQVALRPAAAAAAVVPDVLRARR